MSQRQFGRRYRLEIGDTGEDGEGITTENLRVAFDIKKTIDSKPNAGVIRVWNMNRNHINQALSGVFKNLRLSVGYNELRLIYVADIIKANVKRSDLDWVTEFECADGGVDYQKAYAALTLAAGSTDQSAVAKLVGQFTEAEVGVIDLPNKRALPRGKVMLGNNRDILNQICRNNQADWSIQDNELIILTSDKVLAEEAVLLSQDTGLIGSPEATDKGLDLTCLLNPSLKVGGLVRVQSISSFYDGDYKIVNIDYSGDALSGDWRCKLSVVRGEFQKVEKDKK